MRHLKQDFGRNPQSGGETADHRQTQRPMPAQDFGNPALTPDERNQIFRGETLLSHSESDGRDGAGKADGKGLLLILLDEQQEQFQFVPRSRSGFGGEE